MFTDSNPKRGSSDFSKGWQEKDHQDLAELVSGHHVSGMLRLDLELLLDGRQHAGHVREHHPLSTERQIY